MDRYWVIFIVGVLVLFGVVELIAHLNGGTLSQRVWRALPEAPWLRVVIVVAFISLAVWAIGHLGWKLW